MTGRAGLLALLLACATLPCTAQATGAVVPAAVAAAPGASFQVEVRVDVTATGQDLGGYGAVLTWDPAVLQYTGTTAGPPPFDVPALNDTSAAAGVLQIAGADAAGQPGNVTLFLVDFQVIGYPCDTSSIALSMTSLFAAATLDDLLPLAAVQNAMVSVEDHDYGLQAMDSTNTILTWNPLPGAGSYDVIRGDTGSIFGDPGTVHPGAVLCWEEDSLDATTAAGTEAANPDTGVPLPGEAFFYLVRARIGGSNLTYGFPDGCMRERLPDSGDCL